MRSALSFVSGCLAVLGLSACGSAREQAQTGTNFCFNCHSETSALGIKISWAQAGYANSVHFGGQVERDYAQVAGMGVCPPFAVAAGNATCVAGGGTTTSTATAAGICTMPADASQTQCDAAAAGVATFLSAVADPR
ncbi:MAG TPA: hypothetical protein VF341_05035, partial [Anaeromyxobacteraceae bacterium]